MRLICYTLHDQKPLIRPAPVERDWMDHSPEAFAYRCLPLDIANAHGWEVLCSAGFDATWDGGTAADAITIAADAPPHLLPVSHFGSGVLTFHLHGLFRTEPAVQLWVAGSPNRIKDGIQPLAAVVETDWAPYTFTMNWRFTRPGRVRFEQGEPFCFFFPLRLDLIEQVHPVFMPIEQDAATAAAYRAWVAARNGFNAALQEEGSAARAEKWQKGYFRGRMPDGAAGGAGHRTRLRLASFQDASGAGGGPDAPDQADEPGRGTAGG
ncbi:DUF6065 family protein [Geminicoccus harenae]|uniref:DUF6065 family protein n=1 Tax=Geminicoccus harenae TaxID=2498453 RepID=UPI001CC2C0E5|nr:DUF6065 family protein [Geminicoccus harenae]